MCQLFIVYATNHLANMSNLKYFLWKQSVGRIVIIILNFNMGFWEQQKVVIYDIDETPR